MRGSEKAYLIVAFVYSLLWAAVCVIWIQRFLAGVHRPFSGVIAVLNVAVTAGILIPSIVGLKRKRLTTCGSIVQFVFLFFTMYGIPVAIWGIGLLRSSMKTDTAANNRPEVTGVPPSPQP